MPDAESNEKQILSGTSLDSPIQAGDFEFIAWVAKASAALAVWFSSAFPAKIVDQIDTDAIEAVDQFNEALDDAAAVKDSMNIVKRAIAAYQEEAKKFLDSCKE